MMLESAKLGILLRGVLTQFEKRIAQFAHRQDE
jgi:hypothetical protein